MGHHCHEKCADPSAWLSTEALLELTFSNSHCDLELIWLYKCSQLPRYLDIRTQDISISQMDVILITQNCPTLHYEWTCFFLFSFLYGHEWSFTRSIFGWCLHKPSRVSLKVIPLYCTSHQCRWHTDWGINCITSTLSLSMTPLYLSHNLKLTAFDCMLPGNLQRRSLIKRIPLPPYISERYLHGQVLIRLPVLFSLPSFVCAVNCIISNQCWCQTLIIFDWAKIT